MAQGVSIKGGDDATASHLLDIWLGLTLKWLAIRLSLLGLAFSAGVAGFVIAAPTIHERLDQASMSQKLDHEFIYTIGKEVAFPYSAPAQDDPNYTATLLENGHSLGSGHAQHEDIHGKGNGRYSVYYGTLHFSASDNTDPRLNGRTYTLVYCAALVPWLSRIAAWIAIISSIILCLVFQRGLLRWAKYVSILCLVFRREFLRWAQYASLFLSVLALAYSAAVAGFVIAAPTIHERLDQASMSQKLDHEFIYTIGKEVAFPYSAPAQDDPSYTATLLENGHSLGSGHAQHEDIRGKGNGRYSVYYGTLHFSASDNTDPRLNGRTYALVYRVAFTPWLTRSAALVAIVSSIILCAAFWGELRRFVAGEGTQAGLLVVVAVIGVLLSVAAKWAFSDWPALGEITLCAGVIFLVFGLAKRAGLLVPLARGSPSESSYIPRPIDNNSINFYVEKAGPYVLIIIGAVIFLYLAPLQLYPPIGWADPWIYQGYFKHYDLNIVLYGPTYFPSRLPFIMLGATLYNTLPNEVANFVMILLPTLGFILPMYFLIWHLCGRSIANVTTILTISNALVLASMTQGYVVGLVMAFMTTGYAILITSFEQERVAIPSFTAGVCLTLAALTHPIALTHLPFSLGAILLVYPAARRKFISRLAFGLGGALTVALAAAVTSKILNGSSIVVFSWAMSDVTLSAHRFGIPFRIWGPYATRLWYFLSAGAIGCAVLLVERGVRARQEDSRARAAVIWATLSLLSVGVFYISAQLLLGTAWLSFWFYSAHLTIYAVVIFAGVMRILLGAEDSWRTRLTLTTGCVVGAAVALAAPILSHDFDPRSLFFIIIGGSGLLVATSAVVLVSIRPDLRGWVANLGVLMVAVVPLLVLSANPDTRHIYSDRRLSFRDAALTAEDADNFILGALHGRYPFFWYIQNQDLPAVTRKHDWKIPSGGIYPLFYEGRWLNFGLFDMIWSFYYTKQLDALSQASSFAASIPDWSTFGCSWKSSSIVVLSGHPEDEWRATDRLHQLFGTEMALSKHREVSHGSFSAHIWLFNVVNPGRPSPQQSTQENTCEE